MHKGYIKIHRKMTEWEWYQDTNTFRLFMHLLLNANHSGNKFMGKSVPAGSLIIGRKSLSGETGLSEQQIRTAINKLKSTNEITIKATNKFSICTIVKWADYQYNQPAKPQQNNQRITNNQPTSNQQVTTIKECKNVKNVKNKELKSMSSSTSELDDVFFHWQKVMNHPRARLGAERKKAITKALNLGYSVDDLMTAIDGCRRSDFHRGANDRGAVYDSLTLILRDSDHIDSFIATAKNGAKAGDRNVAVAINNDIIGNVLGRHGIRQQGRIEQ